MRIGIENWFDAGNSVLNAPFWFMKIFLSQSLVSVIVPAPITGRSSWVHHPIGFFVIFFALSDTGPSDITVSCHVVKLCIFA